MSFLQPYMPPFWHELSAEEQEVARECYSVNFFHNTVDSDFLKFIAYVSKNRNNRNRNNRNRNQGYDQMAMIRQLYRYSLSFGRERAGQVIEVPMETTHIKYKCDGSLWYDLEFLCCALRDNRSYTKLLNAMERYAKIKDVFKMLFVKYKIHRKGPINPSTVTLPRIVDLVPARIVSNMYANRIASPKFDVSKLTGTDKLSKAIYSFRLMSLIPKEVVKSDGAVIHYIAFLIFVLHQKEMNGDNEKTELPFLYDCYVRRFRSLTTSEKMRLDYFKEKKFVVEGNGGTYVWHPDVRKAGDAAKGTIIATGGVHANGMVERLDGLTC